MKFIISTLLMLSFGLASAETTIPTSCKPVAVKGELVTVSAKKPLLVIIHNLSNSDLWITHPVSNPSASAGWNSRLQAGKWSALALDKPSFALSCIESRPGHEQQVPCTGMISVCQWRKITMPGQSSGTFWAGENMNLQALIEHLSGRGFGLPDSPQ